MESEDKLFKCVQCGEPAAALYKQYGPSVLKLTKCERCKGFVDKYVEYDPVIVMIDLILMSKEAQRHVIYNTEFKVYWKIFVLLTILETYGVWRNDSLLNIFVHNYCTNTKYTSNYTDFIVFANDWCEEWVTNDSMDLFIMEKNFYIIFISIFLGIVSFVITIHLLMKIVNINKKTESVSLRTLVKSFSLANVTVLLTLPTIIWSGTESHAIQYVLIFLYSLVFFTKVFQVVYNRPLFVTVIVLVLSNCAKFATTLTVAPLVRKCLWEIKI